MTALILPPGIFAVLLFVSAALFIYRKHRGVGTVNLVYGLLIWLCALNPVANFLTSGLESKFNFPRNLESDVIILLGGGIIDNVPDLTGYGTPSDDMLGRIITAVRLQKKLHVPIIVSGGKVFEKVGMEVTPFPANFKSKNYGSYGWYDYLPASVSLGLTAKALHEYIGILYYKLVY